MATARNCLQARFRNRVEVISFLRWTTLVCCKELPRLYELRDQLPYPPPPDAYDFEIKDTYLKLKQLRDIEAELQGLDRTSWDCLKADLIPLLTARDAKRGWQALFDKLNEAKGYNYLVQIGCSSVKFIPRSSARGHKTPDLQGILDSTNVLCEVKTINISEVESACRNRGSVRNTLLQLPVGFFSKLKSGLDTARNKMEVYRPGTGTMKIAYVIINYDDLLHEYAPAYAKQVNAFIATKPVRGLKISFDIKPPFYCATL